LGFGWWIVLNGTGQLHIQFWLMCRRQLRPLKMAICKAIEVTQGPIWLAVALPICAGFSVKKSCWWLWDELRCDCLHLWLAKNMKSHDRGVEGIGVISSFWRYSQVSVCWWVLCQKNS
jgi:hypothetical protein